MSAPETGHDALIRDLAGDLAPVSRPWPPAWQTALWLTAVVVIGVIGALFADLPAVGRRLAATPDMALAVAGSALTAILAAVAAFQLALPDRSRLWALLPLPAAALWIAASGAGCLRSVLIPGTRVPGLADERDCLLVIVGLSVPLSALLIAMLRKGYALRPGLTALVAGLAAAGAAATLLTLFHPYDATASDLAVHGLAVIAVVAACRVIGGRSLAEKNRRRT